MSYLSELNKHHVVVGVVIGKYRIVYWVLTSIRISSGKPELHVYHTSPPHSAAHAGQRMLFARLFIKE